MKLNTVLSDSVRHPDKNKSPEAHEKMLEINKAYEVTQTVGCSYLFVWCSNPSVCVPSWVSGSTVHS